MTRHCAHCGLPLVSLPESRWRHDTWSGELLKYGHRVADDVSVDTHRRIVFNCRLALQLIDVEIGSQRYASVARHVCAAPEDQELRDLRREVLFAAKELQ